jgi:hypothetical protein
VAKKAQATKLICYVLSKMKWISRQNQAWCRLTRKKNEQKWLEPGAKAHQVQLDNFEHSTQKDSQLKLWLSLKKTLKL